MCVYIDTHTHTVYCICALKKFKTWSCRISSLNLLKTLPYNLISKSSLHGHTNCQIRVTFCQSSRNSFFNANNMLMCPHDNHLSYELYTRKKEKREDNWIKKKQGIKGMEET